MRKVTILNNQSLFDISVQLTGTALNALELAQANNKVPSVNLIAGEELIVPNTLVTDDDILRYYQANTLLPASALTQQNQDTITGCEGIGCWAIGIDFKVS